MDPFEDWAKTRIDPCVQKWATLLIDLGASWDTFRREKSETIDALVDGGIPRLAAQDIWNVASEALSRSQAPLSIFWDIENMPIPTAVSGNAVAARLKSIVAPHGRLLQFRGYASIGLNHIPEEKRSELQLSGCHLVDCPHNGRKEVADKMIIVDAMEFAFSHLDGATLCFITGDVDYAYLLAKLQKPQWTTIVISKGTLQSMLHVNCDVKMRWETDVLLLRPSPQMPHKLPSSVEPSSFKTDISVVDASPNAISNTTSRTFAAVLGSDSVGKGDLAQEAASHGSVSSFEALTDEEQWTDDAELLRSIVAKGSRVGLEGPGTLKSYAGLKLRETNTARFPDRSAIKEFLAKAIENGIVVETGGGATKLLHLPDQYKGSAVPAISLSEKVPLYIEDMPAKAIELSSTMPYMLFLQKFFIPDDDELPGKACIEASGTWMIIMFRTLTDAQRAVAAKNWLSAGVLVDWRRSEQACNQKMSDKASDVTNAVITIPCLSCAKICLQTGVFAEGGTEGVFCRTCFIERDCWGQREQSSANNKVVSMLEMMADNDDIYVARNILRKSLTKRWPVECASRDQAALWIESAIKAGTAIEIKRQGVKAKVVCLPINIEWALAPFSAADTVTPEEEEYVKDLLWENEFCMTRKEVNFRLKDKFPRMNTPMMRTKMFLNAASNGSFYFAKGPTGHFVALSRKDAHAALRVSVTNINEASVTSAPPLSGSSDDDSALDGGSTSSGSSSTLSYQSCL